MQALGATLFFLLEGILLSIGTIRAANGQGFTVFVVALAAIGALFVYQGCLGNAPKH
ncbi:MAG: hypothetical protein ACKOET_07715 [Verrucomicrobiota bacterium]